MTHRKSTWGLGSSGNRVTKGSIAFRESSECDQSSHSEVGKSEATQKGLFADLTLLKPGQFINDRNSRHQSFPDFWINAVKFGA